MAKRTTPRSDAADMSAPTEPIRQKRSRATDERSVDPGARPEALDAMSAFDAGHNTDGPTDEDIRKRAYQRYLERGGGHGMDFEDWLEAEKELRTRR